METNPPQQITHPPSRGETGPADSVADAPEWPAIRAEVLALDVRCDRTAPAIVRAALSRVDGLDSLLDDATLVASELVTNVVLHSEASQADTLRVTAVLGREGLRISVHDPGSPSRTTGARAAEDPQLDGWGLEIVEQLASRWGSGGHQGYRVWADVPWPSPTPGEVRPG